MIDTMTGTKIVGGACGALLVFLLGNLVAESLYHVGGEGHGEEHAQAYTIPVEGGEGGGEAAGGGEDEAALFAAAYEAADPAAGEKVFNKCKACHKIDGTNGTGPHLDGVVGRPVASVAGFEFSGALKALGGDWTPEHMEGFLKNPKGYAAGTKMGFAGLPKIDDRASVIKYLSTVGG